MQAVTGVFSSQTVAEEAIRSLQSSNLQTDRITLLTPGEKGFRKLGSVPVDTTEQPGIGTAMGAVVGGATGLSAGLVVAVIPGVGTVAALGLLGAALLTAAGASLGAALGRTTENFMSEGLPEDEIFGRSVVIALAEDAAEATTIHRLLESAGAEAVDAAREQWWIGLRNSEQEHYLKSGRNFRDDEKFYRMGFEAALHARSRCKEFDQVSAEMASSLEDVQRQFPGVEVAEPFTQGYQRGREYYQRLCDKSKAA
jgi:hypothetical protein